MAYEVVVPRLGLTMEEARIVEWYKESGERVEKGELLFAVETDKAVQDMEAAISGIVFHPETLPPDPLPIGEVIGYIAAPDEEVPAFGGEEAKRSASEVEAQEAKPRPATDRASAQSTRKLVSPAARRRAKELGIDWRTVERPDSGPVLVQHVEQAAQISTQPSRIEVSPVARRMAESAGIDLTELAADKPGERIMRADIEAAMAARAEAAEEAEEEVAEAGGKVPAEPSLTPRVAETRRVTQIRRIIAERMVESAQTTAPLTLTSEADATELVELRQKLKAALELEGDLVPTYNDLMVKLAGVALQRHPMLNAYWKDDKIQVLEDIHIGVAVDAEAGLVVPVVRDVPNKSVQQIAEETRSLAVQARSRELSPDDLQGGTFTLTNLGMYGIDAFTPIINLPECAILGVGRIISKPAVQDGELVARYMMTLSLTFDHRVVDGGPAARFLSTVREFVENPHRWLVR